MEQEIASDFRSDVGKLSDTARQASELFIRTRATDFAALCMGVNFSSVGNYRVDVKKRLACAALRSRGCVTSCFRN
jgi:hypothetical protein